MKHDNILSYLYIHHLIYLTASPILSLSVVFGPEACTHCQWCRLAWDEFGLLSESKWWSWSSSHPMSVVFGPEACTHCQWWRLAWGELFSISLVGHDRHDHNDDHDHHEDHLETCPGWRGATTGWLRFESASGGIVWPTFGWILLRWLCVWYWL